MLRYSDPAEKKKVEKKNRTTEQVLSSTPETNDCVMSSYRHSSITAVYKRLCCPLSAVIHTMMACFRVTVLCSRPALTHIFSIFSLFTRRIYLSHFYSTLFLCLVTHTHTNTHTHTQSHITIFHSPPCSIAVPTSLLLQPLTPVYTRGVVSGAEGSLVWFRLSTKA
jgi:hypothetical protein